MDRLRGTSILVEHTRWLSNRQRVRGYGGYLALNIVPVAVEGLSIFPAIPHGQGCC